MKTLPHNIEAEQAVIGTLLYDAQVADDLDGLLDADHYYDPVHGRIHDAIVSRIRAGRKADAIAMKTALANDPAMESLGGAEKYLATLLESAADSITAIEYARIVRDMSARREIIRVASEAQTRADDDMDASGADIAGDTESALARIQATGSAEISFSSGDDGAEAVAEAIKTAKDSGGITGVRTGLTALDSRTGGLQPGNLIIIAGRPSMGKTALAGSILQKAAGIHRPDGERQKCFFVSLEMTRLQVWQRCVVSEIKALGGVTGLGQLRKGFVSAGDERVVEEAMGRVRQLKGSLLVDDTRNLTIADIRRRARSAARMMGGLDLIAIDYLGLINKPEAKGRNEASVIGEMSRALKIMAGEFNAPVILLSQLSRQLESRDNKRPMLSDLRDSGAIEQDADDVFFVYRDAYYLKRDLDAMKAGHAKRQDTENELALCTNTLEVICSKQRQGPIGTDRLHYNIAFNYITDEAGGEQ